MLTVPGHSRASHSPLHESWSDEVATSSSASTSSSPVPQDSFYLVPSPELEASFVFPLSVSEGETVSELAVLSEPSVPLSDSSSSLALAPTRSSSAEPPTWAENSFATQSWVEQADMLFPLHQGGVFLSSSSLLPPEQDEEDRGDSGGPQPAAQDEPIAPPSSTHDEVVAELPRGPEVLSLSSPNKHAASQLARRMGPCIYKASLVVAVVSLLAPLLAGMWGRRHLLSEVARSAPTSPDVAFFVTDIPAPSPSAAKAVPASNVMPAPDAVTAPDVVSAWEHLMAYWSMQGGRSLTRAARGAYYLVCRTREYAGSGC